MNVNPNSYNTAWAHAGRSATVSGTKADIIYDIGRPVHRKGILEVLAQAFVQEPSTAYQSCGRPSYDHWYQFTEYYIDACTSNSLSAVALDARDGNTVLGALITTDFLAPPDPQCAAFVAQIDAFGPIEAAIDTLDKAWFEKHSDIAAGQTGRVADLWMGGVRPEYRKGGIITRLAGISIDQATKAGFEYAVAECTGAYSQRLVEAAGFSSVYELPYADFFWKGKAIFNNVPAPHNKWAIYEQKLN
jgi:GNAT superfamily N-acetyltransferase